MPDSEHDLPVATVHPPRRHRRWMLLIPLLAILAALYMVSQAMGDKGPQVEIGFVLGHGLKPGDALRYRGIEVGRVEDVVLRDTLEGIRVRVRLHADAAALARDGSRFWIVRPELGLTGSRGLDTVVGGKYLMVYPGDGPPRSTFTGLEEAPLVGEDAPGGFDILLQAREAGSLRPGAPVTYRDLIVGTILDLQLAADHTQVVVRAEIANEFRDLITADTRFWRRNAASVHGGLFKGMTLDIGSMQEIMLGGVALAVPLGHPPTDEIPDTFRLYDRPEKEWEKWLELE